MKLFIYFFIYCVKVLIYGNDLLYTYINMGDFIKSFSKEVKIQIYESTDENKFSDLLELCQDLEKIKEVRDLRKSRLFTEDSCKSYEYEILADMYFENEFKECIVKFIQKMYVNTNL